MRSFLGLASYYRKFVAGFAKIAHPLTQLTKPTKKFQWNSEAEKSFKKLKKRLTEPPILAFPNFELEFILFTDASDFGIGAVLSQMIDTKERVIAYYSRHLSVTEQNYSNTEKECLAVVNAVKHFRPYLLGRHFTLIVDHQPLEYLKKAKDTNRRVNRWSLELASYDYTIKYRKGRVHNNADALSRIPKESKEIEHINQIQIINQSERMKEFKSKDTFCNEIINFLANKHIQNNKEPFWMKQVEQFKINENGLFVRETEPIGNRRKYLTMNLVVPMSIRNEITATFHDELLGGHLGFKKTYNKIRDRFYWPKMSKDN